MAKKRVLITGAAGFLGSHLCDRFIKEGYDVVGMDNLITGDLRNIEHLFKLKELGNIYSRIVSVAALLYFLVLGFLIITNCNIYR